MRTSPLVLGFAFLLGSLAGCSETPAPVVPTPVAAATVAAPEPAPVALPPVAEPDGLFVVARWKNPNASLDRLTGCAGVPSSLAVNNVRNLLDRKLGDAFDGADGRQIADIVDLNAPVDVVVSLEGGRTRALRAVSLGLTSLERAKQAVLDGELQEVAPSLWRVGHKEGSRLKCVIGPAAGPAPARLICGAKDKDIATLGPYLARNLSAAEPPAQDLHAELRFAPVYERYSSDLRRFLGQLPSLARGETIGEPAYDRALEEAAAALSDEGLALVADLERIAFEVNVDPTACLTAKASLSLRGKTSWTAGSLVEHADRAGPAPAVFWRAPIDSDAASFGRGADPARYAGVVRVLRGLLEGKLAKEQIGSEADRKALSGLISLPLGKDTSVVFASGHAQGGLKPAPTGDEPTRQQMADEVLSHLGWYMVGVDEGPGALAKMLRDFVAVYNRKGLIDPLRKALRRDAEALPKAKLVPAPRQLGAGALDLALTFQLGGDKAKGAARGRAEKAVTFTIHVLLMPDGRNNTWLAVGVNRDELVKRLLGAKAGAPEAGTLAARAGLDALMHGKAPSSGFITLGIVTRMTGEVLSDPFLMRHAKPAAAELGRTLNNLPHKGETPIFLTSEATASGPRSDVALHVQKGTFEDLGVILMKSLRLELLPGVVQP